MGLFPLLLLLLLPPRRLLLPWCLCPNSHVRAADLVNVLFWNLNGFDCISVVAGEIQDPAHALPRGLLLALAAMVVTCGFLCVRHSHLTHDSLPCAHPTTATTTTATTATTTLHYRRPPVARRRDGNRPRRSH